MIHTTIGCGKQGFPSAQPYLSHTPGKLIETHPPPPPPGRSFPAYSLMDAPALFEPVDSLPEFLLAEVF
ncbi:hypothetical protein N7465_002962 [Penicillium sp. CMV-2018d]|nr:hypothetical protein N7465_002962 [Penicillium sp. CMV-2018d]